MLTDAHLHLGEMTDSANYPDFREVGVVFTCTAKPSEWTVKTDLAHCKIKRFYGVHPWYSEMWNDDSRGDLLKMIESDSSAGIGEIGLDYGRGDVNSQKRAFEEQLAIAEEYHRITEIHMLSEEREVLETLKRSKREYPSVLHSFRSESYVKPFTETNCYFSVNPRLLSKKPESVSRILRSIPRDRLLLESDAPHVPRGFSGMRNFTEDVATLMGIPAEDLENTVHENLMKLIRWKTCTRAPVCC